ncbi:hypothetical protein CRM22_006329 [Opisthorchis felineus]|uniref:TBC1 domain family member 2B n=1 Tax=Opisthorchis felineus TaxID=147828 RepID=A0A4S2LLK4_OPIFE|nr:hypothetical protein CRM22_006329 [Opisthorchis felineus]TGZ64542.1 hypothetical protein CRM22_006329 [Opisthorchis felineus]
MSRWQRLSGYLHTKPTGPFRRFKGSQKHWYEFDESTMTVRAYRNEDEANAPNREPLRVINIVNAAFFIDPTEFHQFVITSEGKDNILQAETEEAMMLWLDTLQARRNEAIRNDLEALMQGDSINITERRRQPKISTAKLPTGTLRISNAVSYDVNDIQFNSPMKPWRVANMFQFGGSNISLSRPTTPVSPMDSPAKTSPTSHAEPDSPSDTSGQMVNSEILSESSLATDKDDIWDTKPQTLLVSTTSPIPEKLKGYTIGSRYPAANSRTDVRGRSRSPGLMDSHTNEHLSHQSEEDSAAAGVSGHELKYLGNDFSEIYEKAERSENAEVDGVRTSDYCGSLKRGSNSSDSGPSYKAEDRPLGYRQAAFLMTIRDLQAQLDASLERESSLRQMLASREAAMAELDHRISQIEDLEERTGELSIMENVTNSTLRHMVIDMERKQRVLTKKLHFLVSEVRDLSAVQHMLTDHGAKQVRYTKKLNSDVLQWKYDYVKLLESCLGAFRVDSCHGLVFGDYGRSKLQFSRWTVSQACKVVLAKLLEEARRKDPTLPLLNRSKTTEYHVDIYGFKQSYADEVAVLHYVCRHLREFLDRQRAPEADRNRAWTELVKSPTRELSRNELKHLCRAGVPAAMRGGVWRMLIHGELKSIMTEKGPHYYNRLISEISESKIATKYRKQISLDLLRTMPNNIQFDSLEAPGIQKLQEILQAYSIHNPAVGYCQGMNFLVAIALLFLNKEDAFWCLTAILERYLPKKYFNCGLISAQVDQLVLKDLLASKLPRLAEHIQRMEIDISAITLNWFLAIFYDSVPFETLIRIWDIFLLDGSKCLFRFALALLKRNEEMLMHQSDTISFWKCLKSASRLTYDADSLVKTAYEELKPFFSRNTLMTLQNHHYGILSKAMSEKQRLWQRIIMEVGEREIDETKVLMRRKNSDPARACVQAAISFEGDQIWICHGGAFDTRISAVDVEESKMMQLDIEMDAHVSSLCFLNDDIMLIGLMSGKLCAYSIKTKELFWQLPVHDSITDIVVAAWPYENVNKMFAGLSNGELVVIENAGATEPKDSTFVLCIGFTRIASLLLVDNQLWCACGNSVYIFNAATLDYHNQFCISENALDLILTMKLSRYGVWIGVRGSPIIELWDVKTLNRLLLFNTHKDAYVSRREDDEGTFDIHRVTALLPHEESVWVGTGNGDIIVFEVATHLSDTEVSKPGAESEPTSPTQKSICSLVTNSTNAKQPRFRHHSGSVLRVDIEPTLGCTEETRENTTDANTGHVLPFIYRGRVHSIPVAPLRKANTNPDLAFVAGEDNYDNSQENTSNPVSTPKVKFRDKLQEEHDVVHEPVGETELAEKIVADVLDNTVQSIKPTETGQDSCSPVPETNESTNEELREQVDWNLTNFPEGQTEKDNGSQPAISSKLEVSHDELTSSDTNMGSTPMTPTRSNSEASSTSLVPNSPDSGSPSPIIPSAQPMFYPLRRESRNPDAMRLPTARIHLQAVLRNKVSETPIRTFLTHINKLGESIIVSCATYFYDDDAILKWSRCEGERSIWTNNPIFFFDQASQQIQFPAYMMNTLRMRRESLRRRITLHTGPDV